MSPEQMAAIESRARRRAEFARKDSPELREASFNTTTSGLMRAMAANMVAAADILEQMAMSVYEMSLIIAAHTANDHIAGNVGEMK